MSKKNRNRNRNLSSAEKEMQSVREQVTQPEPAKNEPEGTNPLPEDPLKLLAELKKREAEITQRERVVAQREIEADAGFPAKNADALSSLTKEKIALQQQVEALRSQLASKIEQEIAREHEARLKSLNDEIDRSGPRGCKEGRGD